MSFDKRSHKPTTFAVESFWRLGVEGSYFIDQLAVSVVGGRDGGSTVRMRVLKERLLQTVSVTTQVTISRKVSRFKLQLRDGQDARTSQGGGDDRPTPMAWGWSIGAEYEFRRNGDRVCNKKEGWNKDSMWGRSMISWK